MTTQDMMIATLKTAIENQREYLDELRAYGTPLDDTSFRARQLDEGHTYMASLMARREEVKQGRPMN